MKRMATIVACVLYVVSPIDLLPEAVLGPFGLPDDVAAVVIGLRAIRGKRAAEERRR